MIEPPRPSRSYAQWARRVARALAPGTPPPINIFGSTTPEPTELLRRTIAGAFEKEVTTRYAPTFAGDNAYVRRALLEAYADPSRDVMTTPGATGALSVLFGSLVRPGARVLVESPGFDLFGDLATAHHAQLDTFPRRAPGYGIDPEEMATRIRPDTCLIILTNLHNPTGAWLDRHALDGVAEVVERFGLPCVIDEVYAGYGPTDAVAGSALSRSELFIAVNSLTKVYGLPSLRCGWIAGAPRFIEAARDYADRHQFAVSRLAHAVAALVLEDRAPFEAHWRATIGAARAVFEPRLASWREAGLIELDLPRHGCMFFPHLPAVADTLSFAEWLLETEQVLVAPGEFFGAAGHLRLGFSGSPDEIGEGLDRLERGLRRFTASGRHG